MVIDLLFLATGVVLAAAGGELFVRGLVGLAFLGTGSAAGVIGATVAAFESLEP